ncbi:putative type I RM modification enzyme [Streptococcus pneumoniae]|nr:putative type I RM modification enzyme [Streptococcus pneumoniae]CAG5830561.1 putative type I RM modification enzyme [Streptococcus pneumoniae]VJF45277.1 putative type I RM modification enzyme [Streptococcus pneumoniae]VKQ16251.1 putative type I RM modification enzyme [Streptococcus pneumoniae]VLX22696.1 putative type I RM modification enzyme [Streptococcus pneumoniae]
MKKVKLGEVLSLKKGKKATVLAEQTTLSQRYIQIDDLRNNNNLKFTESLNMTEALPDDILIAWDGANAGTVGYGLSGAVGSTITVLKKNERYKEKIISDYLGVFLESKSQYLRDHSTGATIPHLNKNILLDLQLELLGIEEQENIICILNTIKRLITKRKFQLDELNLLVKSRFNEMFEEYPDSVFLDTYIKELRAGKSLAGEENNKNKVLKTGAVSYDYFNSSEVKNLPIDYIPLDEHKVEIGDVIISRMNTSELVGAAGYVWAINSDNIYLPDRLWKVILNDRVNPVFLWKLITNEKTKLKIKRISSGTSGSMKNISKSQLLQIRVPFPPLALQNKFADFVALVDKSRFNEMFGENKIFESIDNLFDIIDGDRGKNYPKSDELFSEEYCLFLNTKNVTKNGFSFDTKQFITKTKDKLLRKGKLERYDIVLTTRGTVGNVAYYDELIKYKHLRINSGMVILRPKTPNLNQKFIIHVLRNNNYSRVISGSAQPQLPITKLKKILLPLPPLALQNEFADFVAQVDKSQFACEIAIKVWRNSLKFSII